MISTTIIGFKENIVIYLNVMHSLEMNKISTENKIPTAKKLFNYGTIDEKFYEMLDGFE